MTELIAVLVAVAGFSMMIIALLLVFPPAALFVAGALCVSAAGRVMRDAIE